MDTARSARAPETPRRTPGKNDFKRPKFALGRISFGPDGDDEGSSSSSSSSSSAGKEREPLAPAAMALSPLAERPLAAATGNSNNNLAGMAGSKGRPFKESSRGAGAGRRSRGSGESGAFSSQRASPAPSDSTLLQSARKPAALQDSKAGNIDRAAANNRGAVSAKDYPAAGATPSPSRTISGVLADGSLGENNRLERKVSGRQHQQQKQQSIISPRPSISPVGSNTRLAPAQRSQEDDAVGYQGRRVRRQLQSAESRPIFDGQRSRRRRNNSSALTSSGGSADTLAEVHALNDDDDSDSGGGGGNQENLPPSRTGRDSYGAAPAATAAGASGANAGSDSNTRTRTSSSPPRGFHEPSACSDDPEEIVEIPIDDAEMLPFFYDSVDGVENCSPPPLEATSAPAATSSPSYPGGSRSPRARQSTSSFASPAGSSFFNRSMSPPPQPLGRISKSHGSSSGSSSLSVPARDSANGGGIDNSGNSSDVFADCLDLTFDPADSSVDCLDMTLDPADSSVDCTQQADCTPLGKAPTLTGNGAGTSSTAGGHASDALDAKRGCTFVGSRPNSGTSSGAGRLDRRRPDEGGGRRGGGGGKTRGGARSRSSSVLDVTGGSSSDDDFVMAVLPSPRGATKNGTSSPTGANDRYSKPEVVGEWEREADNLAWKMEVNGSGGEDSSAEAFSVPSELYKRMYPHQRIGIRWLWGLHQGDMGGILGDDMGLGKTFQVRFFCEDVLLVLPSYFSSGVKGGTSRENVRCVVVTVQL